MLTRMEAQSILTRYYKYLRDTKMDHLFWDVINQSVIALGGEGDATINHDEFERRYLMDGVAFPQVMEEEIRWTEKVPEIDSRLPEALKMAKREMERRGWM